MINESNHIKSNNWNYWKVNPNQNYCQMPWHIVAVVGTTELVPTHLVTSLWFIGFDCSVDSYNSSNIRLLIFNWVTVHRHHGDVIKWTHFPRYWSFVRGIHRSPVNSPHKGQWRGALMLSLICLWINGWLNNREAGDLRRYRAYYDVTVMMYIRVITMALY